MDNEREENKKTTDEEKVDRKTIAKIFGKSVGTIANWEKYYGFPCNKKKGKGKKSLNVTYYLSECKKWESRLKEGD